MNDHPSYTELQVVSNFSFLRGASHPEELVEQAALLGYKRIAITDCNTVAGVVRAHAAAKKKGISIIPGCRLNLLDGPGLLMYPTTLKAWSQLCTLLTTGNLRTEKGDCRLYKKDVYAHAEESHFVLLPPETLDANFNFEPSFEAALIEYKSFFQNNFSLAATKRYGGDDGKQLHRLSQLSIKYSVPLVATNDVHYHNTERRQLQDLLTCIREKCTIYDAGFRLHPNAERYLKPEDEMLRLFRQYPDAIRQTEIIADACTFSLDELTYEYPEEITTEGRTPLEELSHLTWKGAKEIFGEQVPEKTTKAINYELAFIERMNYAAYFLTVYDIVRYARSQGILCQGRGSAANSTVCFCLGITSVNPEKFDLLFERFLSAARAEPPDIDVDFEHERREEVMQYIFNKYGRDRAAIVATVTQQRSKGAIRDAGKAMGLSKDVIDKLSDSVWWFDEGFDEKRVRELGFNPKDAHFRKTLELTDQYTGFVRQLGQHTGGFVITKAKLSDLVPILNARMDNRTCIEWNKDDIDALGFLKIDVLALGMLTCLRKSFELLKQHYGVSHTLASIPEDDPKVYEMICAADTIGVFQIESRAQQSMLPRLKPQKFYDLVIEVAIVRPGPIQGDMVHPYLRRRNGEEPVEYPSKELEKILHRTLGVPLFQEQAMKIAIVGAGFTPAEADELRRSMATFKVKGMVTRFHEKLVKGMTAKGYTAEYAERVFKQLEGFGSYGFPESHAVSFALLVYVSCWLKYYYPDVFCTALLNSQPMGFYPPADIVRDAREHGVEVRPVDVNFSQWDNTLEEKSGTYCAVRLGFRQVGSFRAEDAALLIAKRGQGYKSINALRRIGLSDAAMKCLTKADAFRSLNLDRREALWQAATTDIPKALFDGQESADAIDENVVLPQMTLSEHVVQDYASLSLSVKAHPVSFLRGKLRQLNVLTAKELPAAQNGDYVKVAGLVKVRQRPETAKGVCFMTIEDETGFANLILYKTKFEEYRKPILTSSLIMAEGALQVEGDVRNVIVNGCHNYSFLLHRLTDGSLEEKSLQTLSTRDEKGKPLPKARIAQRNEDVQGKLFGDARNFK